VQEVITCMSNAYKNRDGALQGSSSRINSIN
jgi:hypothetical protein